MYISSHLKKVALPRVWEGEAYLKRITGRMESMEYQVVFFGLR